ncbi:MAG: hypothetical protein CM1200mP22_26680 [Dehalococcoidia bacterium]|nr:MAG: hypothetical protein CM1200mP22_26680 [Dehalococcoidia bacterium]
MGWYKVGQRGSHFEDRRGLAAKAFDHVSTYDAAVTDYLRENGDSKDELPDSLTISLKKVSGLRYGENPHKNGALYAPDNNPVGLLAPPTTWQRTLL